MDVTRAELEPSEVPGSMRWSTVFPPPNKISAIPGFVKIGVGTFFAFSEKTKFPVANHLPALLRYVAYDNV